MIAVVVFHEPDRELEGVYLFESKLVAEAWVEREAWADDERSYSVFDDLVVDQAIGAKP